MKLVLLWLFCTSITYAQLVPHSNVVEKQWIKGDSSDMIWYVLRDTTKQEIGHIKNRLVVDKRQMTLVTTVHLNGSTSAWVDSSICEYNTFLPIRHSSYNAQRDMLLNFGKVVTGFYKDKRAGKNSIIRDTTLSTYFDSNLYPTLIRWLPLRDGYRQKMAIYDYNPSAKIGITYASVDGVKRGTFTSVKSGVRNVWLVEVTDGISNGKSTYYIDQADRKLWKQVIEIQNRSMMMLAVE